VRSALSSRLPRMRNAPSPICTTSSRRQQTSRRRHDECTPRFAPALAGPYLSGDQRRDRSPLSAARRPAPHFPRAGYRDPTVALPAFLRGKMTLWRCTVIAVPSNSRSRPAGSACGPCDSCRPSSALTFPVRTSTRKPEGLSGVCGARAVLSGGQGLDDRGSCPSAVSSGSPRSSSIWHV